MNQGKERYGLFTAIALIVGICIGSGIFFKSDNILVATGGSIFLGVLVFALGAMAIVFGGLCMGELASRTNVAGGVVTYAETYGGKMLAGGFGWFQVLVYYPTITAVVSWVVGIYTSVLFNWDLSFIQQLLVGLVFTTLCFAYNTLSAKFGGMFQDMTTVIKLIPLALIAILGLIFGDPIAGFKNINAQTFAGAAWISAVGPIAFSYDGWIVSTTVAHEIRNSKRNLPLALILAPIFILLVYVLYFVGISSYLGPDQIIAMGDAHVAEAASRLFGSFAAKGIMVFVIISVMGTVNGLVLGFIRLPQALAMRPGMFPFAKALGRENPKLGLSVPSALFAYGIYLFWTVIHYLTTSANLLPNSDVSEISIAMSYLMYITMYYQVFKLYRKGEIRSRWKGVVIPVLATIGSLFILGGAMQSALFVYYLLFNVVVVLAGFVYYHINAKKYHTGA